ncbi:MAG: Gfo/Idh/MocA family protein [Pirellulaceae bacterium]
MPRPEASLSSNRRDFLKQSTGAIVSGSLAATLGGVRSVHAAGSDILRIGLIGCGGRGSGAAVNALKADENTQLVAMADAFHDRALTSRDNIRKNNQVGDRCVVEDDRVFSGFDGYEKVLESDVDVVLLCSTPHFRPRHLRAAIEAGKHVFCEKPVAVDPTGVRSVLETTEMARQRNLCLVSGLCWRYDDAVRETIKQIQDGAIGDIVSMQENYLTGTLWHRGRKPEWSEMEYQLRNWYYFTWLSGDHIVEQHIHSLDKALWLMNDQPPVSCYGMGGRQVRCEEQWGNIYDHFAVCYEWENGVRTYAYTRQMKNCFRDVDDYILGTKGEARVLKFTITGENEWKRPKGPRPSMYDAEHQALFAGIRSGNILNNGTYMSFSTLMAIMGREVCYTGQRITWDEALNAKQDRTPSGYEWGDVEIPQVALPGVTPFA